MREVTVYEDNSGKIHKHPADALRADARSELESALESTGICRGGNWDQDMVIDAIIENASAISAALVKYNLTVGAESSD